MCTSTRTRGTHIRMHIHGQTLLCLNILGKQLRKKWQPLFYTFFCRHLSCHLLTIHSIKDFQKEKNSGNIRHKNLSLVSFNRAYHLENFYCHYYFLNKNKKNVKKKTERKVKTRSNQSAIFSVYRGDSSKKSDVCT